MDYITTVNLLFFTYIAFYFLIEKVTNKGTNINIGERIRETIKRERLSNITLNIKSGNKGYYELETKTINLNSHQTLKELATGFHELGHGIMLKDKEIKESTFLAMWNLYFYNAYLIGIIGTLYLEYYPLSFISTSIINISLATGVINYLFILREEYQASRIGYKKMKREISELTRDDERRVIVFLVNSYSSYLLFFTLTLVTLLYNLN